MAADNTKAITKDILHGIQRHKAIICMYLLCPLWGILIIVLSLTGIHDYLFGQEEDYMLLYFMLGFLVGLIFIIGGFRFIGWYRQNNKYSVRIPSSFIRIGQEDYPKLFQLVKETSEIVGVNLPESIYLEEGTTTAVFVSEQANGVSINASSLTILR